MRRPILPLFPLLAACAGGTPAEPVNEVPRLLSAEEAFWEQVDPDGGGWTALSVVGVDETDVAEDHDYIAEQHLSCEPSWEDDGVACADNVRVRISSERGTPCAAATDEAACLEEFDALMRPESLSGYGFYDDGMSWAKVERVLWNRGDAWGTVELLTDLAEFLAPIDTPAEAMFLAREDAWGIGSRSLAREAPDGVEVVVGDNPDDGAYDIVMLRVDEDGWFTELARYREETSDPNGHPPMNRHALLR